MSISSDDVYLNLMNTITSRFRVTMCDAHTYIISSNEHDDGEPVDDAPHPSCQVDGHDVIAHFSAMSATSTQGSPTPSTPGESGTEEDEEEEDDDEESSRSTSSSVSFGDGAVVKISMTF